MSHFDAGGRAQMVDVAQKAESVRIAVATGAVEMSAAALSQIAVGEVGKGDVLGVARLAAIAGCKRTSELIPLCHPVRVTSVEIELLVVGDGRPRVEIRAQVGAFDRTGVEMEALTAVTIAALTIYDMGKSLDRGMRITAVQLEEKSGGKSGVWRRPPEAT